MVRRGMPRVPVHNNPQRRQQLVESWADCTLQVASIDMSFAPPLIVAQVHNLGNFHRVPRLLFIAPTHECLCLKLDPHCHRPHIVGVNQDELAVVDLIAEREGIQPSSGRSGQSFWMLSVPCICNCTLHSTFIRQIDGVNCHPACSLTLHCALSRRVVKGILQVP